MYVRSLKSFRTRPRRRSPPFTALSPLAKPHHLHHYLDLASYTRPPPNQFPLSNTRRNKYIHRTASLIIRQSWNPRWSLLPLQCLWIGNSPAFLPFFMDVRFWSLWCESFPVSGPCWLGGHFGFQASHASSHRDRKVRFEVVRS
jgi:hypothetical protein